MSFQIVQFKLSESHAKEEEVEKAQKELDRVLQTNEDHLKEKMTELITHTYFNTMMEVDRRALAERAMRERPRVDYYLKSMLFYVFTKLSKGDRARGYELVLELQDYLVNIKSKE